MEAKEATTGMKGLRRRGVAATSGGGGCAAPLMSLATHSGKRRPMSRGGEGLPRGKCEARASQPPSVGFQMASHCGPGLISA